MFRRLGAAIVFLFAGVLFGTTDALADNAHSLPSMQTAGSASAPLRPTASTPSEQNLGELQNAVNGIGRFNGRAPESFGEMSNRAREVGEGTVAPDSLPKTPLR